MAGLKVITPPAVEPVSLGEVKAQLQIDESDTIYDDQLNTLIPAARVWCEQYQNRAYITQTLELALDWWPCGNEIKLLRPPLQSVTSVSYTDKDSMTATWADSNYIVDDYAFVGRIVKKCGVAWPSVSLAAANGVKVRYVAGYGDAPGDVPATIRQAIILLVVHWFNNGLCDPPNAVLALLNLERVIPV